MTGENRNLPVIRDTSPLAGGLTVNLNSHNGAWRLRVWLIGKPINDTTHATMTQALEHLGALIVSRLGGRQRVAMSLLGHLLEGDPP